MKSHRVSKNTKTHTCPSCKIPLTAATGVNSDDKPSEGDISICFACGQILTFAKDLSHEKISDEMLAEIKETSPDDYKIIMGASKRFKQTPL